MSADAESDIDFDLSSVSDLNSEDEGDNVSLRPSVPPPLPCLSVHRQVDRIRAPRSISMIYSPSTDAAASSAT